MKKGAALLIVLLLIAIFGAIVITITRTGLLNSIFANNIISSMRAEEASQSGLEITLLHFKLFGQVEWPLDNDKSCFNVTTKRYCQLNNLPNANESYEIHQIRKISGDMLELSSIGHFGYVVKKHSLTQMIERW